MKMTGRRTLLATLILAGVACSSSSLPDPGRQPDIAAGSGGGAQDMSAVYRSMGRAAASAPMPFVAAVAFFASPTPDTTLAVVSLSLANRALTFMHEHGAYSASYEVRISLRRNGVEVNHVTSTQSVRVRSFKETNRTDESVIFQQRFPAAPGPYTVSLAVRDGATSRASAQEAALTVPRFGAGAITAPVPVYEATPRASLDSIPHFLARPRGSALFGIDTAMTMYVEGYGPGTTLPVTFSLRSSTGDVLWRDTTVLPRHGALFAGVVNVPIARADIGVATITAAHMGMQDTVGTQIFVGFGADLPIVSLDAMLSYLRYFASSTRLQALRNAPPDRRAAEWAAFLRATDPNPSTPEHEALDAYFDRIREANVRFRSDYVPGWLSDRGSVFVALGEPDDMLEQQGYSLSTLPGPLDAGRLLIWDYRDLQARLLFYQENNGGRWRLTPASAALFRSLASRRVQ